MGKIDYDTELADQISKIDTSISLSRSKATSYYGIENFMNNLYNSMDNVEQNLFNINRSFKDYNDKLNDVPYPLSPDEVEKNIASNSQGKSINNIELLDEVKE